MPQNADATLKATVFLTEEQLEELIDLAERHDCPPVVALLVQEIEMWKEPA